MANAALLQLGYGASIASFLGGIHWAMAMSGYGGAHARLPLPSMPCPQPFHLSDPQPSLPALLPCGVRHAASDSLRAALGHVQAGGRPKNCSVQKLDSAGHAGMLHAWRRVQA